MITLTIEERQKPKDHELQIIGVLKASSMMAMDDLLIKANPDAISTALEYVERDIAEQVYGDIIRKLEKLRTKVCGLLYTNPSAKESLDIINALIEQCKRIAPNHTYTAKTIDKGGDNA